MASLRRLMTEYGFESNDDYEYQLRCLLDEPAGRLRCLNVEGESRRRKTAFANALAAALEYPHVLYHDFSNREPEAAGADDDEEQPVSAFDRAVSEACAYSEAEPTILIIDQLQLADFQHHIRLNSFVRTGEWVYPLATLSANPRRFLLFLISEEPLYHSLQKVSFRVWTDTSSTQFRYQPAEFDLDESALPLFNTLAALFDGLGVVPTPGELRRIVHDILYHARTPNALRHSIYGWTEGVDHGALFSEELAPAVDQALTAAQAFLGVDEIEVSGTEVGSDPAHDTQAGPTAVD